MKHYGSRLVWPVLLCAIGVMAPPGTVSAQDSPHGELSFACEECHVPDSWKVMPVPAKFDHRKTKFILAGQHGQVNCMDCHTSLTFKFKKSASRCVDCHEDVHRGELGATCDRCHSPQSWIVPDMIRKHASTRFSLVGVHATVPCQECHTNQQKNEFVGLRTDCFGCHQQDFTTANGVTPSHAGFGTDCQSCHAVNAANWGILGVNFGGNFDHAKTGFPLAGAHATLACAQCHVNNQYAGLPVSCYGCHQQQFTTANSPPHAGFPQDCTTCHTTNPGWAPSTYSHANATPGFPQDSRHTTAACAKCHQTATNYTVACCQSSGCHNSCQGGG